MSGVSWRTSCTPDLICRCSILHTNTVLVHHIQLFQCVWVFRVFDVPNQIYDSWEGIPFECSTCLHFKKVGTAIQLGKDAYCLVTKYLYDQRVCNIAWLSVFWSIHNWVGIAHSQSRSYNIRYIGRVSVNIVSKQKTMGLEFDPIQRSELAHR